ncbi:MAG TPA: DSD1 family PLP-dependent enzyme [Steroidobacteraceae bacterium]|nr:DSD1 family PLP-dependent enzyme [Steroidobacteraceae bacterium]
MLDDVRLHAHLIGKPGSRRELNTPVLVLDRDTLGRNVQKMAAFAKRSGVALRPHAKSHKSLAIARMQLDAGAVGLCCAKLGEAEVLASGGIPSILITSPVVSAPAIERLIALNGRVSDLMVCVDNPANAVALAAAVRERPLKVIIDVDPGIRRTGVGSVAAAVELLKAIHSSSSLIFKGVQMYCGVQQHIKDYKERYAAIEERSAYLRSVVTALAENGGASAIITGSGTGTHHIDAQLGLLTEWQVGSYVFMDRQYAECDLVGDQEQAFEYSLFIDARVVSANTRGIATIDAGYKAMATDGGPPVVLSGAPQGSNYIFMGDEHGLIVDPTQKQLWSIGDMVRLAVPHCDPTVNLYDAYHVVTGDTLQDVWPVSARGRSR